MRTIKDINDLKCLEDLAAMIWVKCCEGGKFDGTKCADVLREWQEWRFKGTVTFTAHPIETAPKDRDIAAWWPRKHELSFPPSGGWARSRFNGANWECQTWVLGDQPTHWAEISDMAPTAVPKEGDA